MLVFSVVRRNGWAVSKHVDFQELAFTHLKAVHGLRSRLRISVSREFDDCVAFVQAVFVLG